MFPMIWVEVHISVSLPLLINPKHLVFPVDFRRIDAFFSEWHFVLLVIVNRCHFFDEADKDWHSIFGKICARVSVSGQLIIQSGHVSEHTLKDPRNQSPPYVSDQCKQQHTLLAHHVMATKHHIHLPLPLPDTCQELRRLQLC